MKTRPVTDIGGRILKILYCFGIKLLESNSNGYFLQVQSLSIKTLKSWEIGSTTCKAVLYCSGTGLPNRTFIRRRVKLEDKIFYVPPTGYWLLLRGGILQSVPCTAAIFVLCFPI
jgi:hypothetical protein